MTHYVGHLFFSAPTFGIDSSIHSCKFKVGFVEKTAGVSITAVDKKPTEDQCAQSVKENYPAANGLYWKVDSKRCWAVFGGNNITPNKYYKACLFKGIPKTLIIHLFDLQIL